MIYFLAFAAIVGLIYALYRDHKLSQEDKAELIAAAQRNSNKDYSSTTSTFRGK